MGYIPVIILIKVVWLFKGLLYYMVLVVDQVQAPYRFLYMHMQTHLLAISM